MKKIQSVHLDEWMKKVWYLHTVEHYSAIKHEEILLFVMTWMDFEGIIY